MSTGNPEITVIIPAYNAGLYLSDCLDSVIGQTYSDWELIIADDGSSDNTGDIADSYASKDSRIRVLHLSKQGVSAARNSSLDIANGYFVAFVDADDKLEPDYLKELYSHASRSDADITQCSFFHVDDEGNKTPDPDGKDAVYNDPDGILHAHFKGQQGEITVSVWGKLFRRGTFSELHFDTGLRVYEDAYYVYLCCRKAKRAVSFSTPLYQYINRRTSVTHSVLPEIWSDYFIMYERQKDECRDDHVICENINRREAETGLWLMHVILRDRKEKPVWELRKKTLGIIWPVLWSSAPFGIKMKLIAVALMPHIYFAMPKKRTAADNEKV